MGSGAATAKVSEMCSEGGDRCQSEHRTPTEKAFPVGPDNGLEITSSEDYLTMHIPLLSVCLSPQTCTHVENCVSVMEIIGLDTKDTVQGERNNRTNPWLFHRPQP